MGESSSRLSLKEYGAVLLMDDEKTRVALTCSRLAPPQARVIQAIYHQGANLRRNWIYSVGLSITKNGERCLFECGSVAVPKRYTFNEFHRHLRNQIEETLACL